MRFNIALKIGTFTFALVFIAATIVGVVFFSGINAFLVNKKLETLQNDGRFKEGRLKFTIETLRKDLLFLSKTLPNLGIVPAYTSAKRRGQISKIFHEFILTKKSYGKISFISHKSRGKEIVRLERFGKTVKRIPVKELKSKGAEPYYKKTFNLKQGVVFKMISRVWPIFLSPIIRKINIPTGWKPNKAELHYIYRRSISIH